MNVIYPIIIFIVVSLCYVHIVNEYRLSEDLEVYEMDYSNNINLQETCNIKQPVIFKRNKAIVFPSLEKFKQILCIKDLNDYYIKHEPNVRSIELPCSSFLQLLKTDTTSRYFSENNQSFIDEAGLYKIFSHLDLELKPKYSIQSKYDILLASSGVCTPFRYHTNSRKFLYVVSGSIKMKMASNKYSKYLHEIKDFENLEYKSNINVWNDENSDIDKIQFVEFDVPSGHIVHIPPFWRYSIKYSEENTIILENNYSTLINKVAFLDDSIRYHFQQHNTIKTNEPCVTDEPCLVDEPCVTDEPCLADEPYEDVKKDVISDELFDDIIIEELP